MIKDLYDNSIVGCKYATQMPESLVIETVRAAVKKAKPSGELGCTAIMGLSILFGSIATLQKQTA